MADQESTTSASRALDAVDFDDGENDESKGSVRVVSGSGFRYVVPFPWRLHQMLEAIDLAGDASIVSWLPNGQHFQVHNPQLFVQKVIPKFFKQKSYKSFQRQLHLYGFQRETDGPNRGAYYHESFMRSDRQQALEISRIKAPKRRRAPPQSSTGMKSRTETENTSTVTTKSTTSVIDRFIPLSDLQKQSTGSPIRNIVVASSTRPGFDPVRTFQQSCSCPHRHHYAVDACNSMSKPASPSVSDISCSSQDASVSDTYNWLINAGVPFSAFDPVAIHAAPTGSSDLYDCADEITSLFSHSTPKMSPAHVPSGLVSPGSSFGINEDATLDLPQDMLGELNSAIWGL
mmetsp:Transcript_49511/g.139360  ORF Transcript_49511/g.139360 Transcript_49511/m.139360 type:complete len:345 (-) Transcript_49511:293-1327(-)